MQVAYLDASMAEINDFWRKKYFEWMISQVNSMPREKKKYVDYIYLVMDRIPEIGYSGTYLESAEILVFKGKLNKTFLHFLSNFWHIWWFFQCFIVPLVRSTLGNHQICQKLDKKMKKSLLQDALNPFLYYPSKTRNPGSGYPIIRHKHLYKRFLLRLHYFQFLEYCRILECTDYKGSVNSWGYWYSTQDWTS